jgi:hypothetical protein
LGKLLVPTDSREPRTTFTLPGMQLQVGNYNQLMTPNRSCCDSATRIQQELLVLCHSMSRLRSLNPARSPQTASFEEIAGRPDSHVRCKQSSGPWASKCDFPPLYYYQMVPACSNSYASRTIWSKGAPCNWFHRFTRGGSPTSTSLEGVHTFEPKPLSGRGLSYSWNLLHPNSINLAVHHRERQRLSAPCGISPC